MIKVEGLVTVEWEGVFRLQVDFCGCFGCVLMVVDVDSIFGAHLSQYLAKFGILMVWNRRLLLSIKCRSLKGSIPSKSLEKCSKKSSKSPKMLS
jgi:hypothetical protein